MNDDPNVLPKTSFLKKILIVGCIAVAGVLLMWAFLQTRTDSPHPTSQRIQKALTDKTTAQYFADFIPPETINLDKSIAQAPEFNIGRYTVRAHLPKADANQDIYTLKVYPDERELDSLAHRLLGANFRRDTSQITQTTYTTPTDALIVSTKTGAFNFTSLSAKIPFPASNTIADIRPQLTDYLKDTLKIIDDTVTATAYYTKSDAPDVTYYEFHRDPKKVGLPILNPATIVNIPEEESISDLSQTKFSPSDPPDSTITSASDAPGKARRLDFNSLVVAVSKQGHILSITSSIRPIEKIQPLSAYQLRLLDPKLALQELEKDGSYFSIAVPSGQGAIDMQKVFAQGRLSAGDAIVTEVALAYIEKSPEVTQRFYQPVYIVRGYTQTESGIRVKFSQAIPAVTRTQAVSSSLLSQIFAFVQKLTHTSVFAVESSRVILCGDENDPVTCRFDKFTTPSPDPPTLTPAIPTSILQTITPSATLTRSAPSVTPVLKTGPCVLLDGTGTVVEQATEFHVDGIGLVQYFPTLSHIQGPLALKRNPGLPPVIGADGQRYDFDSAINKHLAAVGAQILLSHPEKLLYRPGSSQLDLNVLFSDYRVGIDLNDPVRVYQVDTIEWLIRQGVSGYNGLTLQKVADFPQPFTSVSVAHVWYARQGFQNGIDLSQGQGAPATFHGYTLDQRCDFISVISPSLYFYPETPLPVTFKFLHSHSTYTDPLLQQHLSFTASPDGTLNFDSQTRTRIYYEYSGVSFDKPSRGWYIETQELPTFMQRFSDDLGLTPAERGDLLADLTASLQYQPQKPYVFIGLVDQKALARDLPIALSPQPENMYRIHVYAEFTKNKKTVSPERLNRLVRDGFTLLELGVYRAP